MSPYNNDENNTDIKKVAKIDDELSDITKVIAHRFKGTKKSLSNLELQLIWDDDPIQTAILGILNSAQVNWSMNILKRIKC